MESHTLQIITYVLIALYVYHKIEVNPDPIQGGACDERSFQSEIPDWVLLLAGFKLCIEDYC